MKVLDILRFMNIIMKNFLAITRRSLKKATYYVSILFPTMINMNKYIQPCYTIVQVLGISGWN